MVLAIVMMDSAVMVKKLLFKSKVNQFTQTIMTHTGIITTILVLLILLRLRYDVVGTLIS